MLGTYWPRRVASAEPLAAALLDHHRSGRRRRVHALRADGVSFTIETAEYFTLQGQLGELDEQSLNRCRGRVLDVGAGAGRHALALQERGREVVAIDVSPVCSALCRERGVRDARTLDVMTLESESQLGRFDSILFGMQTIGVAGGIQPLETLLRRLGHCLNPGGELIVDSSALREPWEGDRNDASPSRGEIVLSTRYHGLRGEPFPWLYLAEADLATTAEKAGYRMDVLGRVDGGEYLAALTRSDARAGDAREGSRASPDDRSG